MAAAGGNLLRIFFHTDGALNPYWGFRRSASQDTTATATASAPKWRDPSANDTQSAHTDADVGPDRGSGSGDNGTTAAAGTGQGSGSDSGGGGGNEGVGSGCGNAATRGSFGQTGPEEVLGCGAAAVNDLKWLLRHCHRRGVKVLLTLWSQDIMAVRR